MAKSNFIYGLHPIQSLLRQHADRVLELFVQSGRRDESVNQLIKLASAQGIAVHEMDRKQLDKKSVALCIKEWWRACEARMC